MSKVLLELPFPNSQKYSRSFTQIFVVVVPMITYCHLLGGEMELSRTNCIARNSGLLSSVSLLLLKQKPIEKVQIVQRNVPGGICSHKMLQQTVPLSAQYSQWILKQTSHASQGIPMVSVCLVYKHHMPLIFPKLIFLIYPIVIVHWGIIILKRFCIILFILSVRWESARFLAK